MELQAAFKIFRKPESKTTSKAPKNRFRKSLAFRHSQIVLNRSIQ
jgi:hypothetical protein